jgi:hypothetical protein
MAWYAQIGTDKVVQQVIFASDQYNINWVEQTYGGIWIEAFENGGERKNFPASGFTYDETLNAFLPPQPFPSWLLNTQTYLWYAPVPYPEDGQMYIWNEPTLSWVIYVPGN